MSVRRSFESGGFEGRSLETWAVIAGSLLAGAAYAWFAGEDINWDWRNYHEYNAFALINGRYGWDVAPAGIQTFLNPLAYVPAYLLRHHVGAPFWGILLGAIHGLNLALIYWFSRQVLSGAASRSTLAAAVAIAAFGPMTLSEVGTSFADILTALPVIAGLGLIVSATARHRARHLIAGILIGGAVGLKLTNMIFFLGAGASLLFAARPLMALSCFAIGGAIGGLATGGAWAWTLWQEFGNPVFPFYNTIFRSPEAPLEAMADVRFMPHNLWDAAAYPFYWLIGDYRSSEGPFRDPRFAILFVLFAANAGASLLYKIRVFARRDKQFLLFFAVAYATWLFAFSIRRYAVVLELLAAPLIVLLLSRLLRALQYEAPRVDRLRRAVRWTAACAPVLQIRCRAEFGRCIFAAARRGKICSTTTDCSSTLHARVRQFWEQTAWTLKPARWSRPVKRGRRSPASSRRDDRPGLRRPIAAEPAQSVHSPYSSSLTSSCRAQSCEARERLPCKGVELCPAN